MATGDLHTKFRGDRSSGSKDMLADRRVDHNTPHPYRGGVKVALPSIHTHLHAQLCHSMPENLSLC